MRDQYFKRPMIDSRVFAVFFHREGSYAVLGKKSLWRASYRHAFIQPLHLPNIFLIQSYISYLAHVKMGFHITRPDKWQMPLIATYYSHISKWHATYSTHLLGFCVAVQ